MLSLSLQRKRRLCLILMAAAVLFGVIFFILYALRDNIVFYHTPSEILLKQGELGTDRSIRMGGLVKKGSFSTAREGVHHFVIIDEHEAQIPVLYNGLLPNLFAEGRGAVVEGHITKVNGSYLFLAQSVLAKHDENYRAPPS